MTMRLITAPIMEPITVEEMKTHLRMEGDDLDESLQVTIEAGREYLEGYLCKALITQTRELILDAWPDGNEIELIRPPLQSITSVKYYDDSQTEYTFSSDRYILDSDSYMSRIVLKYGEQWPDVRLAPVNGIRIRFVCGYQGITEVPKILKTALKAWVQGIIDDDAKYLDLTDRILAPERRAPV